MGRKVDGIKYSSHGHRMKKLIQTSQIVEALPVFGLDGF
jgi:hypothetical protein